MAALNSIYNAHRDALLNSKYYGHRLERYRSYEQGVDIAQAILTPSALGSWAIWQVGWGQPVWALLAAVAALLAVIKPFLQLTKQIERYTKLYAGYSMLYSDLDDIVVQVEVEQNTNPLIMSSFFAARAHARTLAPEGDPKPKAKLRRQYTEEVNIEKPFENYWRPSSAS